MVKALAIKKWALQSLLIIIITMPLAAIFYYCQNSNSATQNKCSVLIEEGKRAYQRQNYHEALKFWSSAFDIACSSKMSADEKNVLCTRIYRLICFNHPFTGKKFFFDGFQNTSPYFRLLQVRKQFGLSDSENLNCNRRAEVAADAYIENFLEDNLRLSQPSPHHEYNGLLAWKDLGRYYADKSRELKFQYDNPAEVDLKYCDNAISCYQNALKLCSRLPTDSTELNVELRTSLKELLVQRNQNHVLNNDDRSPDLP